MNQWSKFREAIRKYEEESLYYYTGEEEWTEWNGVKK